MKLRFLSNLAAAAALSTLALSSPAQVVYSNGSLDGNGDAWTINFGYQVANTFVLSSPSIVTGADFVVWNFPGDFNKAVDWSIYNNNIVGGNNNLGSLIATGTAATVDSFISGNQYGYNLSLNTIGIPGVSLAAGTYWFMLQNAVVNTGDPTYWDMNGGPSDVYESAYGYNPSGFYPPKQDHPSNTFEILGGHRESVPEPGSLFFAGFGLVGLVLLRRNRAAK